MRNPRVPVQVAIRLSDGIGRGTVVPVMDVGRVAMLML
jgi:hypothetical protein